MTNSVIFAQIWMACRHIFTFSFDKLFLSVHFSLFQGQKVTNYDSIFIFYPTKFSELFMYMTLLRLVKDIIFNEINIPEKIAKKLPKIANNRQKSERSSICCKSQLNTYLKRSVCKISLKNSISKICKKSSKSALIYISCKKLALNSKNQLNTYLKESVCSIP